MLTSISQIPALSLLLSRRYLSRSLDVCPNPTLHIIDVQGDAMMRSGTRFVVVFVVDIYTYIGMC